MPDARRLWSSRTRSLIPYIPGEQPRDRILVKLNTNENPYGPSPEVKKAIRTYDPDRLRLYPDPGCGLLRAKLAAVNNLQLEQIFVGNGSDEILALAFQAFFTGGTGEDPHILFPDITYSFYPVYCRMYDIAYRLVSLDTQLDCRAADFPADGRGLVLANPNAPTGRFLALSELEQLIAAKRDRLVLVDEAYIDFGSQSALPLLKKYDNLLIVRTFSKSHSLAGIRVGFALGDPQLIAGLERVRDSFNSYTVGSLSQIAAHAALQDETWFAEKCASIIANRKITGEQLANLGFEVIPSQANFIFCSHPQHDGEYLYSRLRRKGILVRHFNLPRISRYLRITIGTEDQMRQLTQALESILGSDE